MKFTINDFHKRFPNDDACLDELMKSKYGEKTVCPDCKKESKFHRVQKRRCYECQWCGYQLYPTKNTIFEKSTTSLKDWMYAIYLMTATRSGVSAKELERQLGVTYKTAWRMAQQIRKLMGISNKVEKLKNIVEVDETYYGGKGGNNKRGRGAENKTPVFGMIERKERVRAMVVEDVKRKTIMPIIKANIELGSTVCSDEFRIYGTVSNEGYGHGVVKHGEKQYVCKEFHTQSIEGFWSQLKRSILGTHIWVSRKYLQRYVDEFVFRYNERKEPALMFDRLVQKLPVRVSR